MSVIAVKITPHEIVMGADTQTTYGSNKILDSYYGKIFDINGVYLGGVGTAYENQFLRRFLEEKRLPKNFEEKDFNNLMVDFHSFLSEKSKDNNTNIANAYIMVHNNKAFIFDNWLIREIQDFESIGSGGETARTAYEVFKQLGQDPDLETILKVSCKVDLYCHEPLTIFRIPKVKEQATAVKSSKTTTQNQKS